MASRQGQAAAAAKEEGEQANLDRLSALEWQAIPRLEDAHRTHDIIPCVRQHRFSQFADVPQAAAGDHYVIRVCTCLSANISHALSNTVAAR